MPMKENAMLPVSTATSATTATTSTASGTTSAAVGNASGEAPSAPSVTAQETASARTTISAEGSILSGLFEAADAFIQKEHLVPFQGYQFSNGSWGYSINYEGAWLDVGKYNNYLFEKAATNLVAEAKEKGIELDKKDVVAQLKENNAEIAAMKLDDQKRRELLGEASVLARGGYTLSDIRAFTDMYITAKENGLDVSQVWGLASQKAIFTEPGITWGRKESAPDILSKSTLDWAKELRGRVAESGFFGVGKTVFDYTLD
ncbi:MAG: hypothetical protein LBI31_03095, partial [Zoogloeaceae bacterium]|nr:hypothetical protein [Zoogloeaceae bacterium]